MIIRLEPDISPSRLAELRSFLESLRFSVTEVRTQYTTYLVGIGKEEVDIRRVGNQPGVADVFRVSDPYKLVSRKWRVRPTCVDLDDSVAVVEGQLALMAGPCAIESAEQVEQIAGFLAANGVRIMRGGVFKPRTSPYSFRGLGGDGLKLFSDIARRHGLRVISEVLEIDQIDTMYDYVDIYQVGARNTQNFNLLHALGGVDKPVLIKRGMSGTIEELLQSAEYVFSSGNERLILCERGIRTHEHSYRNTLDLNAIPVLKEKSHLPVVVDPSHGIGIRRHVERVALAGVMAGADGLLVEIHPDPERAASDGQQTLNFEEAEGLFRHARKTLDLRRGME